MRPGLLIAGRLVPGRSVHAEAFKLARTDFASPRPSVGDEPHRNAVSLHALKVNTPDLSQGAAVALAGSMINGDSIGKTTLAGIHGRKR